MSVARRSKIRQEFIKTIRIVSCIVSCGKKYVVIINTIGTTNFIII